MTTSFESLGDSSDPKRFAVHDENVEISQIPTHTSPPTESFEEEGDLQLGYETTQEDLPSNYFYSFQFLGSWIAIGFFAMGGFGGFGLIAPVLSYIKADLGPNTGSLDNWLPLVYTLCLAVGGTVVGRLTDIFGRRKTFLAGAALGVVGAIVCATAKNLRVAIGGQTLIGVSSAISFAYPFAIAELVPVKYRFIVTGSMYVFSMPVSPFTAATGTAFILHTEQKWRWCYWLLVIINGIALTMLGIFYHPPTWHMKHGNDKKWHYIKNFDYVGLFLYAAGFVAPRFRCELATSCLLTLCLSVSRS